MFHVGISANIKTSEYSEKKGHQQQHKTNSGSSADSYSGDSNLDSDDDNDSEDESCFGLTENKMARLIFEGKNSPIPQCLSLWGLNDIDLQITPEALDVIGEQVCKFLH